MRHIQKQPGVYSVLPATAIDNDIYSITLQYNTSVSPFTEMATSSFTTEMVSSKRESKSTLTKIYCTRKSPGLCFIAFKPYTIKQSANVEQK